MHGLDDFFTVVEGGDADVAFAAFAEACAGGGDDLGFVEQGVEEGPGVALDVDPHVGGVVAADAGVAEGFDALADDFGVLEVVVDLRGGLGVALGGVDGLCCALDGVGDAVELGRVAAIPHGVEGDFFAVFRVGDEVGRDDGEGAAHAGEAGLFREGAELDGDILCALNFVDGVGELGVADEGFVSGIKEDEGAVGLGVVYPRFELRLGGGGAGGVVGEAKVNEVDGLGGGRGDEVVVQRTFEVVEPLITAVLGLGRAAGHDVGIDIDGVNGVGNGDAQFLREEFLDVGAVALGTVTDEDFRGVDGTSARLVVVFGNGLAQEVVALLGTVTAESGLAAEFVHSLVHCFAAGRCKGKGDIADAEADDVGIGVLGLIGFDALGDFGEEIRGLEFAEVFVGKNHRFSF